MTAHDIFYNYVEEVDPNLTCAICQSALVDPVTTASCKHTFCRDCITRALAHNPSCPIDRSALTASSLCDTDPLIKLMLDELKVRCEADGCGQVMERGLLLAHLKSCPRALVVCADGDCGLSMARHRLPHHRAYECFHRRMECNRCHIAVTFKDAQQGKVVMCPHNDVNMDCACCDRCGQAVLTNETLHRWLCPAQPVPCTQSSRGCAVIVPRSELETHLATCPFEALSPYFAAMDVRFASIERKYDELRTENEGLRSQLWNMRRGMVIPRSLWGDDSAATMSLASDPPSPTTVPVSFPPPSPLTTPFTASLIPIAPRVVDTDPEATPTVVTEPFPEPHPSPRSRPTTLMPTPPMTDLAPSPMSLSPVTPPTPSTSASAAPPPRDPHAFPSRSTLLSPPPRTSYTDWVLERLPPPSHYHDDGCTALRQAVIHLAAGLDAYERRSEIRTMTESLRVSEEVASLRAIVRPMRMQVARFSVASASVDTPPRTSIDSHTAPSIRESVVFSAQDIEPRATPGTVMTLPAPRWTGRPCAFPSAPTTPVEPHHPGRHETRRLSLGTSLGQRLLGRASHG